MVNKVILVGRLTADPELRLTAAGKPVANLRLAATSFEGRNPDGSSREHTEYVALVVFGHQAEVAKRYLGRGRMVYADGRLKTRAWQDAAGQTRRSVEVVVEHMRFLNSPSEARAREPGAPISVGG